MTDTKIVWWVIFGILIIAPLLVYFHAMDKLLGSPRRDKMDVPPEV